MEVLIFLWRCTSVIVIFKNDPTEKNLNKVLGIADEMGFKTHISKGTEKTIVGIIGDDSYVSKDRFENLDFVENVIKVLKPYKLVTNQFHPDKTVIDLGDGVNIGKGFSIMAGPCAVESPELMYEIGSFLFENGVKIIRGGAFKPRTSPYSFQGKGLDGLKILRK